MIAIVDDSAVLVRDATEKQIREHLSGRSIGPNVLAKGKPELGVVKVEATPRPTAQATEEVVEADPELVDGVWRQRWQVRPLNNKEQADKVSVARRQVNAACNQALPDLGIDQELIINEVARAELDASPRGTDYPLISAWATGAGLNIGAALSDLQSRRDGWLARIAQVTDARAAALKELNDNGVDGIAPALAIVEAL